MTSEEQLRAALLGGGQLTTMLASSHRSVSEFLARRELKWISSLHSQQAVSHVLESTGDIKTLDLMWASIFQKTMIEAERVYKAVGRTYEVESGALLRTSEDAQWRSLRNNATHRLGSLYV